MRKVKVDMRFSCNLPGKVNKIFLGKDWDDIVSQILIYMENMIMNVDTNGDVMSIKEFDYKTSKWIDG